MNPQFQNFIDDMHPSSIILSYGKALVMDKEVERAVKIRNLYGQEVVWGGCSVCPEGNLKGI